MNNDFVRTLLAILLSGCGGWMIATGITFPAVRWVIAVAFSIPLCFIMAVYICKKLGVE